MAAGFKTAQVNASSVPATQTSFPSYVNLSRLGITTLAEAQSVRVYADEAKTTEWAREIVSATEMHVKVPSLTSTTSIYVDWDGVSADYAVTDTYGRNAVWSAYGLVFHGDNATDSSGNNTYTETGSPSYVAGKLGNALDGQASGVYLRSGASPTNIPTGKPNFSTMIWIKWDTIGAYNTLLSWGVDATPYGRGYFAPMSDSPGTTLATFWAGGPGYGKITYSIPITADTWYYFASTYDQTTHTLFQDATSRGTATYTGSNIVNSYVNINKHPNFTTLGADGRLDEVRIANFTATANWITTEYNNQSDEAGFWGTWSDVGGGGATYVPKSNWFM